ncbi:ABC transporter substrate-binding protein [Natrialbaceae archaeon A-CW2]
MSNQYQPELNRRNVLKTTGFGLTTATLAGCIGGDSDDDHNGNGDDVGGNGTNGDDSEPEIEVDLTGVDFTYWNAINVQSRAARRASERLTNAFESQTGATIDVSWEGYGNVIGAAWPEAFQRGDYPVLYDSVSQFGGTFVQGDWIYPAEEYLDELPDEIVSNIDWLLDSMRHQYRGLADDTLFEIPFGFSAEIPFIGRMDHFEQAGLNPDDDFPPSNYDELIETASALQNDGPASYGFQIHGDPLDVSTSIVPCWTVARAGEDGLLLNQDMTDTNIDNDVWVETFQDYVDIFREHELSNPGTPAASDEEVVPQMIGEDVAMSQIDFLNQPTLMEQGGSLMDEGTIRWAPSWEGDAGERGIQLPFTLGVTRPPEGVDEDEYAKKQQAAIEFIALMLSEEVQLRMFEDYGLLPVRQDVWELLPERNDRLFESMIAMAEGSSYAWSAHPQITGIMYSWSVPYFQEALQGNMTAQEACETAAAEIRDNVF